MIKRRRAAVTVALLGMYCLLPLVSAAATVRAASPVGSETVTGGSWGVVPTQSTASPPPAGALTLTATNNSAQYFKVVNTGTEPLVATTYVVAIGGGGSKTALTLTACSVAWTQGGSGSCTGTTTAIKAWSQQVPVPSGDVADGTAVASAAVPAQANATLFIRATPASVPASGATFTITTSVSSSSPRQIGSPATTNA